MEVDLPPSAQRYPICAILKEVGPVRDEPTFGCLVPAPAGAELEIVLETKNKNIQTTQTRLVDWYGGFEVRLAAVTFTAYCGH